MTKLKPCPRCGGEMSVVVVNGGWYALKCTGCPLDFGRYWFRKMKDVVDVWNE